MTNDTNNDRPGPWISVGDMVFDPHNGKPGRVLGEHDGYLFLELWGEDGRSCVAQPRDAVTLTERGDHRNANGVIVSGAAPVAAVDVQTVTEEEWCHKLRGWGMTPPRLAYRRPEGGSGSFVARPVCFVDESIVLLPESSGDDREFAAGAGFVVAEAVQLLEPDTPLLVTTLPDAPDADAMRRAVDGAIEGREPEAEIYHATYLLTTPDETFVAAFDGGTLHLVPLDALPADPAQDLLTRKEAGDA